MFFFCISLCLALLVPLLVIARVIGLQIKVILTLQHKMAEKYESMSLVCDHIRLHITNDCFYFEPLTGNLNNLLLINRINFDIQLKNNKFDIPPSITECKEIFGIFGIISLINGPNLIVVTDRSLVGVLNGHSIWKVLKFEVIPYQKSLIHLTQSQKFDLETFQSMLQESLNTESFYYSTSFDLTHTMQRLETVDSEFFNDGLCARADQRFVWNLFGLQSFIEQPQLQLFTLPIMHGFIKIVSCFVNGRTFDLALISRRSTHRAGTRYNVRGVDQSGNVANFVETEQIVTYGQYTCSVVQTRGSIPLIWSQRPNIKYKPALQLDEDPSKHLQLFERHFDSQSLIYGKQYALNLVNQHGSENVLAREFQNAVNSMRDGSKVGYEAFDFHHHCGRNKWHNLHILMDKIELAQSEFAYFMMARGSKVLMRQTGVFRTNCMDCLDRTNVVQSLIARKSLLSQLVQLGIISTYEHIEDQYELDLTMKNMWADNADFCSIQYAGTGALKTDFTRTGKRTFRGMLRDGYNSAIRYWKNNFHDGFRQDSIDLLLGNYVVVDQTNSPFAKPQHRLPIIGLSYLIFSLFIMFYFQSAAGFAKQMSLVGLWGCVTVSMARYVIQNGSEFVNVPLLFHVKPKQD